jgi:ribonuclease HII
MLSFQDGALWENQQNLCHELHYSYCIGIDEVGRGALAGPVLAAAVCFDPQTSPFSLDDSKKLSPKKREEIYHTIHKQKVYIGLGCCSNAIIDQKNILQATKIAMVEAYEQCLIQITKDLSQPHLLVAIDGNMTLSLGAEAMPLTIIKGDATLASIAAASIIAKVSRDRMMTELHKEYPRYGFAQHKGYGTSQHFQAIQQMGPSCHHRTSFLTWSLYEHH